MTWKQKEPKWDQMKMTWHEKDRKEMKLTCDEATWKWNHINNKMEIKSSWTKWNKMKSNETKWNDMKWKEKGPKEWMGESKKERESEEKKDRKKEWLGDWTICFLIDRLIVGLIDWWKEERDEWMK